jgi:hypothetical protein
MTKRESGAWGYNWTTLLLGDMNTETWSSRLGGVTRKADDLELQKNYFYEIQRSKNRMTNLVEACKEGFGSLLFCQ